MKVGKILLLLFLSTGAGTCFAQMLPNDILISGMGDFTLPSPGQFHEAGGVTGQITQSNRDGLGVSLEYRHWRGNSGAGLLYSRSPTNSKLANPDPEGGFLWWRVCTWRISRDEVDVLYTRRFSGRALRPYLTGGLGAEVLNGGRTESGLDAQFAYVMGAGEDMRLSSRFGLRSGFTADFVHAPTYMDPTYRSARTWMFEPRFGLTYSFGFGVAERP